MARLTLVLCASMCTVNVYVAAAAFVERREEKRPAGARFAGLSIACTRRMRHAHETGDASQMACHIDTTLTPFRFHVRKSGFRARPNCHIERATSSTHPHPLLTLRSIRLAFLLILSTSVRAPRSCSASLDSILTRPVPLESELRASPVRPPLLISVPVRPAAQLLPS